MCNALTVAQWLKLEDEIDAFSIIVNKNKKKPKKYYQFLFSDSAWLYDAEDFNTVMEVWQMLDDNGEMSL